MNISEYPHILPFIRQRVLPHNAVYESSAYYSANEYADDYKKPHPILMDLVTDEAVAEQSFRVDQHTAEIISVHGYQVVLCNNYPVAIKIGKYLYYDWDHCPIRMPQSAVANTSFKISHIIDILDPNLSFGTKMDIRSSLEWGIARSFQAMVCPFLEDDEVLVRSGRFHPLDVKYYCLEEMRSGGHLYLCSKSVGIKAKLQYEDVTVYDKKTIFSDGKAPDNIVLPRPRREMSKSERENALLESITKHAYVLVDKNGYLASESEGSFYVLASEILALSWRHDIPRIFADSYIDDYIYDYPDVFAFDPDKYVDIPHDVQQKPECFGIVKNWIDNNSYA